MVNGIMGEMAYFALRQEGEIPRDMFVFERDGESVVNC